MIKNHDDVCYVGLDGPYIYVLELLKELFNINSTFHILFSVVSPSIFNFDASEIGSTNKPLVSFLKLMVFEM